MARRMDELNALEEAEAEQVSGTSILNLERDEAPVAKLIAALAWVHKRRENPKLKYGDHLKAARTKDNVEYMFHDDEDDEDEAGETADVDVSGGPHPDAEDRALDDAGVPTDTFREASAPDGAPDAPDGLADAEGSVLSLDRSHTG